MLLPTKEPYISGEGSIFEKLVEAGEAKSHITLPFQLHLFLIGCLVEHLYDKNIVHEVLALSFLHSIEKFGAQGNLLLKRGGDEALLLAGLFPERALRLNVSSSYFRLIGQSFYASLGAKFQATGKPEVGKFYDELAQHFGLLEKVLNAGRVRHDSEWQAFLRFKIKLQ